MPARYPSAYEIGGQNPATGGRRPLYLGAGLEYPTPIAVRRLRPQSWPRSYEGVEDSTCRLSLMESTASQFSSWEVSFDSAVDTFIYGKYEGNFYTKVSELSQRHAAVLVFDVQRHADDVTLDGDLPSDPQLTHIINLARIGARITLYAGVTATTARRIRENYARTKGEYNIVVDASAETVFNQLTDSLSKGYSLDWRATSLGVPTPAVPSQISLAFINQMLADLNGASVQNNRLVPLSFVAARLPQTQTLPSRAELSLLYEKGRSYLATASAARRIADMGWVPADARTRKEAQYDKAMLLLGRAQDLATNYIKTGQLTQADRASLPPVYCPPFPLKVTDGVVRNGDGTVAARLVGHQFGGEDQRFTFSTPNAHVSALTGYVAATIQQENPYCPPNGRIALQRVAPHGWKGGLIRDWGTFEYDLVFEDRYSGIETYRESLADLLGWL